MNDMDMQMTNRIPDWLTPVAWIYLGLSLLTALYLIVNIYGSGQRHRSVANELVWITSALYLGPFALVLYHRHGQAHLANGTDTNPSTDEPTAIAGLPGGGASAVAHLIGVPLVLASGLTIAGIDLWVMIIVIGLLAMTFLAIYERTAARSAARQLSIGTAVLAAVITVLAFDIGMGGWMLLLHFNEYMPPASAGSFWFLMQIGILLGLLTGYPAVKWLAQRQQTVTPA